MLLSAGARLAARGPTAMRAAAAQARSYALDGAKGFSEHEQAVENYFFTKRDEEALKQLLKKVKTQTETTDPSASASSAAAEMASLKAIVGKYKVSDADLKALLAWKHAHY
jgi:glycyl-tRNA synthetase beta subunit